MMEHVFQGHLMLPALAACLAVGIVLGAGYFLMLRRSTVLIVAGGRTGQVIVLMLLRLGLMTGVLLLAAYLGFLALLVTAAGVLIGRQWVMHFESRRSV